MTKEQKKIFAVVSIALFAAFTAVGAQIAIPIGPVPIVLTNLFVLLAGLVLGPYLGAASIALYILAGAIGLPVFSGAKGGLAHIAGPTGGYIIGFLLAAFIAGLITGKERNTVRMIIAVIAASLVIYLIGVPWLKFSLGKNWGWALGAGMIPFLIGDAIKATASVLITIGIRPLLKAQNI
ncbi:biotin transporter BioY [Spirochaetia bacterium 38H-sp]|uniref:Biotin transporter n=1 Tax=Rarispira pelagica TaxID=3141764 RepID=A0ABU9UBJ1_9SPIR